jgi:hypothetical protein
VSRRQCCCGEAGCEDCFESGAGTSCCRLSPNDVLMLKIERPAWSQPVAYDVPNVGCNPNCPVPCGATVRIDGTVQYAAAEPLLVMYKQFSEASSITGNGMWFADNGSFGCVGGAGDSRWELWPPLCPQQIGGITNPQPACCGNNCLCSFASGIRTYLGPQNDLPSTQWVCSNSEILNTNNPNLSNFQRDVIENNATNRVITNYSGCPECGGNSVNATAFCDYQGYEWLQGIYDDPVNSTAQYKHYEWDVNSGSVVYVGLKPLPWTLVSVYHKEKWYKACEAYDGGILSDECEQVTNWPCRVPWYWVYACAGVPIFSWEIGEMLDAGKITSDEFNWFFESQYLNKPLGGSGVGKSLINKLETTHWYHPDGSGIGILQTKDWRGITLPGQPNPVPSSETRVVRKDLARYVNNRGTLVRSVVEHQFFHARPGGWTHVCYAPPGGCGTGDCQTLLSPSQIEQQAPQIAREKGCKTSGEQCSFIYQQQIGHAPIVSTQSCFSAYPAPQCSTCIPGQSAGSCTICGGCDDCEPAVSTQCGGSATPNVCSQDVYEASCDSIKFTYVQYWNNQTGNLDDEQCVLVNHAYLWFVNQTCGATDGSCRTVSCPTGPVEQVPRGANHQLGVITSKERLCGCFGSGSLCGGATLTLASDLATPTWLCRGRVFKPVPNNNRDPGTPQKPPYTSDGCGSYLCNDINNPLGACCVTDSLGQTVCIDAVTQAQCEKCGRQSGYSSFWGGKNTCCLDQDLCG